MLYISHSPLVTQYIHCECRVLQFFSLLSPSSILHVLKWVNALLLSCGAILQSSNVVKQNKLSTAYKAQENWIIVTTIMPEIFIWFKKKILLSLKICSLIVYFLPHLLLKIAVISESDHDQLFFFFLFIVVLWMKLREIAFKAVYINYFLKTINGMHHMCSEIILHDATLMLLLLMMIELRKKCWKTGCL